MKTILALQPNAKQIGYSLFEGSTLVDWGAKDCRSEKTRPRLSHARLAFLGRLIDRYDPSVIVLPTGTKLRRTARNRFLRIIRRELSQYPNAIVTFSRHDIRKAFAPSLKVRKPSKQAIMQLLVKWFPELEAVLPKPRRVQDDQDYRTPMFDAIALAVTYLSKL